MKSDRSTIYLTTCAIQKKSNFRRDICFNIVCNEMTYGLECALNCSKCRNGTSCHHQNGTCIHGCADGLYGDMCQEGQNILLQLNITYNVNNPI